MSRPAGSYFLWWDVIEPPEGQCYVFEVWSAPNGGKWAERRPISRPEAMELNTWPFRTAGRR